MEDSLRTQKPKIVLIETFNVNNYLENRDIYGEIYYTKEISNFYGKRNYLKTCFGNNYERYISYYFPLYAFHDNWENITYESFMFNSSKYNLINSMGFCEINDITEVDIPDYKNFTQEKIDEKPLETLRQIVKICKDNDIEIIFYTAPYAGEYRYYNAMEEFANDNDCRYINLYEYLEEMKIDENKDFSDKEHLNKYGVNKVARFFGQYIIDNNEYFK